jgi:hypothetical protein
MAPGDYGLIWYTRDTATQLKCHESMEQQTGDGVVAGLSVLRKAHPRRFMGGKMTCRVVEARCRC